MIRHTSTVTSQPRRAEVHASYSAVLGRPVGGLVAAADACPLSAARRHQLDEVAGRVADIGAGRAPMLTARLDDVALAAQRRKRRLVARDDPDVATSGASPSAASGGSACPPARASRAARDAPGRGPAGTPAARRNRAASSWRSIARVTCWIIAAALRKVRNWPTRRPVLRTERMPADRGFAHNRPRPC